MPPRAARAWAFPLVVAASAPAGRWSDQRVHEGAPSRAVPTVQGGALASLVAAATAVPRARGSPGGLVRVTWGRRALDVVQAASL